CGVMCMTQHINRYNGEVIGLGDNLEEVGYNLFKSLREMDKKGVDIIYSEAFEDRGVGQAIMNRLLKSAGYKIIQA
ncbi:MAG TPA: Sua5 family C-terminal domain-containing protein, partial [Peptostreptococcaceae bacterium]|nr:Sua5 family C-terminal domain-containing protein [Peptostreptococcaceae bacterium]